jgi:uncharacterized protein (UPF0333 family)
MEKRCGNMNNMTYIGIGVLVVIIIVGALLFTGGSSAAKTTATTAQTAASSQATTMAPVTSAMMENQTNTTATNNTYNSTTTIVSGNTTTSTSTKGCAASKYFTCSNVGYANGNLSLSITQDTGTSWSAFGVAYAPAGTPISQGTPTNVTFYLVNQSSTSNVGASLAQNTTATISVPVKGAPSLVNGAIWVCYVNSGLVYVGNGCIANGGGGGVPTYVQVATINLTSS